MDYLPLYKIMRGYETVQVNVTAIECFYRFFLEIQISIEEHDTMHDKCVPQENPYIVRLEAYDYDFNAKRETEVTKLRNECNIPCVQHFTTRNLKAGSLRMLSRDLERASASAKKQLKDLNHRISKYTDLEDKFNATTIKERQIEENNNDMKLNGMFLISFNPMDYYNHERKRKRKRKRKHKHRR